MMRSSMTRVLIILSLLVQTLSGPFGLRTPESMGARTCADAAAGTACCDGASCCCGDGCLCALARPREPADPAPCAPAPAPNEQQARLLCVPPEARCEITLGADPKCDHRVMAWLCMPARQSQPSRQAAYCVWRT